MNLPKEFQKKMQRLLGKDYENYLHSFEQEYGQTLRVNQLKAEPADLFRRFILAQIPWCKEGFYYKETNKLSMHPYYYGGVYYLQEPSAMAPASFLPVYPGDKVLDICAAPGGKTTALAGKLKGEGVLVSNDISASRAKALLKNVEMAGIKNVMILCESPEKLADHFPGFFDKILVDAPCSGEGMFRKDSSMVKHWSQEEVERYSKLQKEILTLAVRMLRPGGYLLYSTCTYSPEENEQVVEELLQKDTSFSLVKLPLPEGVDEGHPEWSCHGAEELKYCRRFWNHRLVGEGQFAALLHKEGTEIEPEEREEKKEEEKREKEREEGKKEEEKREEEREGKKEEEKRKKKKGRKGKKNKQRWEGESSDGRSIINKKAPVGEMPEEMAAFFEKTDVRIKEELLEYREERVFLLPEGLPDMKGLRVIRSGLYLGDCKKKRFEPSQALAMALKPEEYHNTLLLSLGDERVEKYLRCETIEGETADGWVLVCVDGYPLGWGKSSKGRIKNKYAAGWRKN